METPLSFQEKQIFLKKIKMGTKEWAWKTVNLIKGCDVNCPYCYAKAMGKRRGITEENWRHMEVNWKMVNKGYGKVKKKSNAPWDIMFPSSHNIPNKEPYFSACMKVLKKILYAGNTVLVTLKPFLSVVKEICNMFYKYKSEMAFRFTIGSCDSEILKILEPNASNFEERIEALEHATESGFPTTVSAEPLLDLTPYRLNREVEPYLSEINYVKDIGTIWIGLLKMKYLPLCLRKGKIKAYLDKLLPALEFDHFYLYYEKLYNHPRVEWKESITSQLVMNDIKVKGLTA